MTYHNAVKYILTAPTKSGPAESLDRIRFLCDRIGVQYKKLRYIRFVGSNGKTVCQTMLSQILKESGMKVGSLIMPAFSDPQENILIDGAPLSMEKTVEYTQLIAGEITKIKASIKDCSLNKDSLDEAGFGNGIPKEILSGKTNISPTKNELIMMIALLAFKDANCDICLIECEHNGADPTKLLSPPFAAVICGTIPGENTREINRIRSYLQSGITEVISAPQSSDTYKIISGSCARINCRLTIPTRAMLEVKRLSLRGSEFIYKGQEYSLGLCGKFQIHNATTIIETVEMLNRSNYKIEKKAVLKGLSSITLKSKFEALSILPTIICDSTHKSEAVGTMCQTLADFKEQTGENIRLCISYDIALIDTYIDKLCELGYSINELIVPSQDAPDLNTNVKATFLRTPKAIAKHITSSLNSEEFVLITGEADFAAKVRREVLRILEF